MELRRNTKVKHKFGYTDRGGGTFHNVSTETGDQNRTSMADLMYHIEDGGDHSQCTMKVVGAPSSWPAEMVR